MNFNKHSDLEKKHAFLSASKYHWVNYDPEKLTSAFKKFMATQLGTQLHMYAATSILLGIKLPKTKKTLNMYVNDAIGFGMTVEQPLYYSENCFGTADAISFKKNFLRIHDLKTGESRTSIQQLLIYMALFCLEYNIDPRLIEAELRIYQYDEVVVHTPDPEEVLLIMDKIVDNDKLIEKLKIGE